MTRIHGLFRCWAVLALLGAPLLYASQANAIKYMGTKEAIKHFLPQGAALSKVDKTLSADQIASLRKKYALEDTADFKNTLTAGPHTIYIGRGSDGKAQIYIFILEQYWRTCYHKFAVGVTADGKIQEVTPMELPCPYQRPVAKKSFLQQFSGKQVTGNKVPAKLKQDIDVVTGATASCEATTIIARRALALFEAFFVSQK